MGKNLELSDLKLSKDVRMAIGVAVVWIGARL